MIFDTTRHRLIPVLFLAALAACSQPSGDEPAAGPAQTDAASGSQPAAMARTPAPPDARVYFVTPADGDVVASPVTVEFAVDGMDVVPAGENAPNSGHHHVIIDTGLPPMNLPIPADERHVHFGDGSSSTELELDSGQHTLQLVFADHLHIPHDPPVVSDPITITVE